MKKINKLSLVLLLGSLLSVASCGNPGSSVEDPNAEVEITFYSTMGASLKTVFDTYLEDFNAEFPNIKVNHNTDIGGYDDVRDQTATELSVGAGPDVVYCYADHVALYNKTKKVVALDKYIDDKEIGLTDEQYNDYIKGYLNEGRQFGDGKMYMLPFSKSTEILYYNKTVFDALELKVPTHWYAADENDDTSMEYVCNALKEEYPDSTPLGYDSESNFFITQCEQLGLPYTSATGENFLFNTKAHKDVMTKFKGWYDAGYITTQEIFGSYTSGLFVETGENAKNSFMSIGSSAGATHQRPEKVDGKYPFEVGIAPIPQMNENNPKVISQGPSLCIFQKANPQEVLASWLFVKFLTTSVEFQAEFSMASGYVPVLKSVLNNTSYKNFLASANGGDKVAALSAKVCMEQEHYYYTSPAFTGSSKARDEVGLLLTKILSNKEARVNAMINKAFADAVNNCKFYS